MTATNTRQRPRWEDQTPGQCWDCGGDCLNYKGHEHGWRCRACLDRYLDQGWATWQRLGDKERHRITQGFRTGNGDRRGTEPEGRRGGGGLAAGRAATTTTAAAPQPSKVKQ